MKRNQKIIAPVPGLTQEKKQKGGFNKTALPRKVEREYVLGHDKGF